MKRMFKLGLLACALGSLPLAPAQDFQELDRLLDSWTERGIYSGWSIVVVRDGKEIHRRDAGGHDENTSVYVASAGKWYMAACIMTLVDDGLLSLDEPVSQRIPEFRNDPKGKATLRQLLAHTSGYPNYQPRGFDDNYQTLQESVVALLPRPIETEPGTAWNYGGLAMQVAGRMAELASGMTWEELWKKKMGDPLGMTATHWTPVDPGHIPKLAGGCRSSLHDYRNFLVMLSQGGVFEGRRVLSEAAVREMGRDQVRGARIPPGDFVERQCGEFHTGIYGLGHWREKVDEAGRVLLESSPSWAGAYPWIDRERNLFGVFIAHKRNVPDNTMHLSSMLPRLVGKIVDAHDAAARKRDAAKNGPEE